MITWRRPALRAPVRRRPGAGGKPAGGVARAAYELSQWLRHVLAWAVGVGLLGAGVCSWSVTSSRTQVLVHAAGGLDARARHRHRGQLGDVAKYRREAAGGRDAERAAGARRCDMG